ncbi:hypothetical protein WICPIJ_001979 [Wickerhamomyces pijperi]|uniref:Mitochondrial FAD carrier protein FLX1 n=1 Tax=Wickerhamomyces pijperi TaxID=599730 RepID=A0A9P8TQ84_WICPI|nr:hypothetical protein WICPIJ_001979 [Wickerhamomyces pijperi]
MSSIQVRTNPAITPHQREILSGLTAGFITTTVTHPLDLLKIRLQLDQTSSTTHFQNFQRQFSILYDSTSKLRTLQNVYRGLLPNLIGNSIAWSIYFTSYRVSKDISHKIFHASTASDYSNKDSNLQTWQYLTSAFAAGSFTALLTNPLWVLKTRILSTNKSNPGAYQNITDGMRRILKEEGILGFWKGFVPSLMGVSQGALQFAIYDTLKYQIYQSDSTKLEIYQYIIMSCSSKMVSLLILYPIQLLKSRLQDYESIKRPKTLSGVIKEIITTEGVSGFYKGVVPNLMRVLPATCITFGVYEQMKIWV